MSRDLVSPAKKCLREFTTGWVTVVSLGSGSKIGFSPEFFFGVS